MSDYIDMIDTNGVEWTRTDRFREAMARLAETEAERDRLRAELLAAQDSEATALREVEVLRRENEAMRAELKHGEWAATVRQWDGTNADACPRCLQAKDDGHHPDCRWQRALGVGEKEGKP